MDEGNEETEHENSEGVDGENKGSNEGVICYDNEIDSSKSINEAVQDICERTPADCLADIYADNRAESDESDVGDRGLGINLDPYVKEHFTTRGSTNRWMEWDG